MPSVPDPPGKSAVMAFAQNEAGAYLAQGCIFLYGYELFKMPKFRIHPITGLPFNDLVLSYYHGHQPQHMIQRLQHGSTAQFSWESTKKDSFCMAGQQSALPSIFATKVHGIL